MTLEEAMAAIQAQEAAERERVASLTYHVKIVQRQRFTTARNWRAPGTVRTSEQTVLCGGSPTSHDWPLPRLNGRDAGKALHHAAKATGPFACAECVRLLQEAQR